MAKFVLIEAQPWRVADGVAEDVRLAGGGRRAYDHRGFTDWKAGVAEIPAFSAAFQYSGKGWTGGAVPQNAGITFQSYSKDVVAALLSSYLWVGAKVTVRTGDDDLATPVYVLEMTGTIAAVAVRDNVITFGLTDMSVALDDPLITAKFAGTGGIEGVAEAEGRLKRRSFGLVRNVEGFILDKASNVFEFGDPAVPLTTFLTVSDMGRPGPLTVLAWQGSAAATLTALAASSPPAGGATVAPSIACVKWWTIPAGPLTADIQADVGTGSNKAADVAARILATSVPNPPAFEPTLFAAMVAARPATTGIHISDDGESAANALDRLLVPSSILWSMSGDGQVRLTPIQLSSPIETLAGLDFERLETFRPVKRVALGYRKNHRVHNAGEISAAILATDIDGVVDFATQVGGATKPEPNADVTSLITPSEVDVSIQTTSAFVPKSGQLPRDLTFKLVRNGVQIATGVTWERRITTGMLNGVTSSAGWVAMTGSGVGTLTLTSIGSSGATIEVRATYAGTVRILSPYVIAIKADAPAVGGGGGGGGGGGSSAAITAFTNTTAASNTYGSSDNALPNVSTGSAGTLTFTAPLYFYLDGTLAAASLSLYGKWQYRAVGAGTWIDVAAEIVSSEPSVRYNNNTPADPEWLTDTGVITINQSKTGLTANTAYEVRLVLRDNSTTRGTSSIEGTATAAGS